MKDSVEELNRVEQTEGRTSELEDKPTEKEPKRRMGHHQEDQHMYNESSR